MLNFSLSSYYKLYYFKNKGTSLLLLWSFSAAYIFHKYTSIKFSPIGIHVSFKIIGTSGIFFYPILGWLADVRFGRYRAVKYSLQAIWALSILQCLIKVVFGLNIKELFLLPIEVMMLLVLGGFLANIIQLGIDQIPDAPSVEISSFVRWYGWVWFLGQVVAGMSAKCYRKKYELVYALVDPFLISVVLCLESFCGHWLMEEPTFKNPLKVIFQVLQYAYKHKYPHLRSAYSYWDSKYSSRIDLAKSIFGGPFTTDEVENVKAFFRMVVLLTIGSFFVSMIVFINDVADKMSLHLKDDFDSATTSHNDYGKDCFWRTFVDYFGIIFIVVAFPLLEFFLLPWVRMYLCLERLSLTSKFIIGMLFNWLAVVNYGMLDAIGHYRNRTTTYDNSTCILNFNSSRYYMEERVLPLHLGWLMLPSVIYFIGNCLMIVTAAEFICAQSPSSMKGLLFGMLYGIIGFAIVLNLAWLYPVQLAVKKWLTGFRIGCGAIYFLFVSGVMLIIIVAFCFARKCYKKTQRDIDRSAGIIFNDYWS